MKINKKVISLVIYAILLIAFSTLSYADAITDKFSEALLKINNFFESNQYEAYVNVIDFGFFSLLFISIYLIGARYGFKQLGKPEKTIAVLLGFLTAFLLVSGGFSIAGLIPYMHWALYILLFSITYAILKGVPNKFWRFVFALAITFMIIWIALGYLDALEVTPIEG